MKLFEYAILFVPKKDSKGNPKLISGIKTVLAEDVAQATILAAREIPEDYISRLSEVQVAVRPF